MTDQGEGGFHPRRPRGLTSEWRNFDRWRGGGELAGAGESAYSFTGLRRCAAVTTTP